MSGELTPQSHSYPQGYADPAYAALLGEWGNVIALPRSGAHLLESHDEGFRDLSGPYPFLSCSDWSAFAQELRSLTTESLTFTSVLDPWAPKAVRDAFPDHFISFKTHYYVELGAAMESSWSSHHRRKIRQANAKVTVRELGPGALLEQQWWDFYQQLRDRHNVQGMSRFSERSLKGMLKLPHVDIYGGYREDRLVSIVLWLHDRDRVHYHLGASLPEGYGCGASYAVFAQALQNFRSQGLPFAALGGCPGLADDPKDGLSRFKRGFSTHRWTAFLGGRILNPEGYADQVDRVLVRGGASTEVVDYFPAYRVPKNSSANLMKTPS